MDALLKRAALSVVLLVAASTAAPACSGSSSLPPLVTDTPADTGDAGAMPVIIVQTDGGAITDAGDDASDAEGADASDAADSGADGGRDSGTLAGSCSPGVANSCCYAADMFGVFHGSPQCGWKRLNDGDHATIQVRLADSTGTPGGPFLPVDMTAVVQAHFASSNDCNSNAGGRSGYFLSVSGGFGSVSSGIDDFSVKSTGEWGSYDEGAGDVAGLVDPQSDAGGAGDGGDAGDAGLVGFPEAQEYACNALFETGAIAGINVMTSVDYSTGSGHYVANFAADAKLRGDSSPTAYYLVFTK